MTTAAAPPAANPAPPRQDAPAVGRFLCLRTARKFNIVGAYCLLSFIIRYDTIDTRQDKRSKRRKRTMSSKQYVPAKLGNGHEVHLAAVIGTVQKGRHSHEVLVSACSTVNSHNINRHPSVSRLPDGTEITCQKCLAKLAKEAAND